MPCFSIHLAVAKKYLELHPNENYKEFIEGTLAPDISQDKNASHYGENFETDNAMLYMKKKTNLKKYLEDNEVITSFDRGYFLHLLCDEDFFDYYINNPLLKKLSFEEAARLGYLDYDRISPELYAKYRLETLDLPDEIINMMNNSDGKEPEILERKHVLNFIEEHANINIDFLISKLKESNKLK